jgi:hypothetical protein
MKRLKNRITPRGEIEAGRLVRVHVYDPKTTCSVCSEPNPLKTDLWVLITNNGLNDIPGCCPKCRSLYTIHVIQSAKFAVDTPVLVSLGQT